MAMRPSIWQTLRWDFLLLFLLATIVGLWAILEEPYLQRAEETQTEGSRPPDRTEGDVLVLLPDTPAAEAGAFDELDCSYGWFNALWQEYGSFASSLTRKLSPEILAGRSVVVVPRRVAESMPSTGVSALAKFVRDGGQLILEQPGEGWERLSGVSGPRKTRPAQHITSTEGLDVRGPMRRHLPDVPLVGKLHVTPRRDPFPLGPSLLDIDGQPGILLQQLGEGQVYTLLFDFGCTTTALQQGLPTRGMSFGLEGGPTDPLPASGRIAHERLKTSRVPYADLLERALFGHLSRKRPQPRLWYFPGTYAGALLLDHAAPTNTRAALGYAEFSRKQEGTSTVFVAPDRINPAQMALMEQARADVGLLWVRGHTRLPVTRSLGIGSLRPLAEELALPEQLAMLAALDPDDDDRAPVFITRVEATTWDNEFSKTFRQLADAHVRLDASLGPSGAEEYGFMFGTGFPYYPLDGRGLPLPLLEHPFVLHARSLTPERLERFLVNSETYFHQPLTVSLPAYAMRQHPSAGALLGLRSAHALAAKHNHWVATERELMEFLSMRRQSVLTSQWSKAERRLTISVNLLGSSAQTLEDGAIPGVAFPRTYDGEEVARVVLDGREVPLRSLATSGPSLDRILSTGPGRHTISVYYDTPEAPEPLE